jgi:ketosteroid isomerase-like protein
MDDTGRRLLVERHHAASARGDMEAVHAIYHDDAVIEYPQSGERIVGREQLRGLRESYPAKLDFSVRRIVGSGDLWITEYVISYDGKPVNTLSIMEFDGGGDAGNLVLRGSVRSSRVAFGVGRSGPSPVVALAWAGVPE